MYKKDAPYFTIDLNKFAVSDGLSVNEGVNWYAEALRFWRIVLTRDLSLLMSCTRIIN